MRGNDERGETLLELLVSVAIMGTAFVAIIAGFGTTLLATDVHRQQATGEVVLRSYAERIQDPVDVPYVDCATTSSYSDPVGFSLPSPDWDATVTAVRAWQGDTPPTFSSSCPALDTGLQQLTLQVRSPAGDHQAIESIVIVKRRP